MQNNYDHFQSVQQQAAVVCVCRQKMGAFSVHPSTALVKFWQGIVEVSLRVICIVSYHTELDRRSVINKIGFE